MLRTNPQTHLEYSLGLYLHWPFCETKCGYCDFYSVPLNGRDVRPLLLAFAKEIRTKVGGCADPVQTIFWGGGTPTTLDHDSLDFALSKIREATVNDPVVEFTIEANPATIDDRKAAILRDHGVTRVSLGAQSFHERELHALERLHAPHHIPEAVTTIRKAGIANFNLDLIFGVGGQTLQSWTDSLRRAIDLEPHHLACYGLTYEAGTSLTKQLKLGTIQACDEQLEANMFLTTKDILENAGFEHYEISNYAKPDHRCVHNLIYWNNGSYLGVGPSAAGCVNGERYKNVADINQYIRRMTDGDDAIQEREVTDRDTRVLEVLMMRMRLIDGLDLAAFEQSTGIALVRTARAAIDRLTQAGLIECDGATLKMTRRGLLLTDTVISDLAAELDTDRGLSLKVITDRRSTEL